MEVLVANLQNRIASLEEQLTTARREQTTNEQIILCLSRLLARQSQNDAAKLGVDQAIVGERSIGRHSDGTEKRTSNLNQSRQKATQEEVPSVAHSKIHSTVHDLAHYPTLQPSRLIKDQQRPPVARHGELVETQDLLDIGQDLPSKPITTLRGEASVFVPKGTVSNFQATVTSVVPSASSDTAATLPLSFSVHDADSDKPPVLDLSFKGLRTAHDGPLKEIPRPGSAQSRSSRQTGLSFGQIFRSESSDGDAKSLTVVAPAEEATKTVKKKQQVVKSLISSEAASLDLSKTILNFSLSNSYRSTAAATLPTPPPSRPASSHGKEDYRRPLTKFHGIHYKPKEDDFFFNRSRVMILGIPVGTTTSDIMGKIRGGIVISCQVLKTESIYGTLSAMIRFSRYHEAMRFVSNGTVKPLVFGNTTVSVELIATPSYPLAPEIYKNIFEHGHTRCLVIYNFTKIAPHWLRKQYGDVRYIEHQTSNGCGDWAVRFTSVERASSLWGEVLALRRFKLKALFTADPCDVEEAAGVKEWKQADIKVMETGSIAWKD